MQRFCIFWAMKSSLMAHEDPYTSPLQGSAQFCSLLLILLSAILKLPNIWITRIFYNRSALMWRHLSNSLESPFKHPSYCIPCGCRRTVSHQSLPRWISNILGNLYFHFSFYMDCLSDQVLLGTPFSFSQAFDWKDKRSTQPTHRSALCSSE